MLNEIYRATIDSKNYGLYIKTFNKLRDFYKTKPLYNEIIIKKPFTFADHLLDNIIYSMLRF
jgi:hypothetical protein